MPLQSTFLRGDPKLEAAAVSDPAHVFQGARGPHVGKIQQALNTLAGAGLNPDEAFGPLTAAAVAAFKSARGLVNYAGQIDNIVGKGTMAALDAEMLAKERNQPIIPPQQPSLPQLPPPNKPPPESQFFAVRCEDEVDGAVIQANEPPAFFQFADVQNKRAALYYFGYRIGESGAYRIGAAGSFSAAFKKFSMDRPFAVERLAPPMVSQDSRLQLMAGAPARYTTEISVDEDGGETFKSYIKIDFSPAAAFPTWFPFGIEASLLLKIKTRPSMTYFSFDGVMQFVQLIPYPSDLRLVQI